MSVESLQNQNEWSGLLRTLVRGYSVTRVSFVREFLCGKGTMVGNILLFLPSGLFALIGFFGDFFDIQKA